ncbi:MAG: hypothetical protein QOG90_1070 [Actinomycetota bacterium]|jgi:hypothetical protein
MSKHATDVLVDKEGGELGKVTDVIPNPRDLEPEFIVVKSGRFGGEHLVPVAAVKHKDGEYVAPFDADVLKDTPSVDQHTAPTTSEREALYEHYGVKPSNP